MPRVPVYNAPQVEARALPGAGLSVNATPGSFGAEQAGAMLRVGEGLGRAANAIADFQQRDAEKYDANLFLQADATLKEKYLKFKTEAEARQGTRAWGVTRDTESWWEATRKEHAPQFKTESGRMMFERAFEGMRVQSVASMRDFETKQQNKSLIDSSQAAIAASTNWAAASPNDGNIAKAEAEIDRAVRLIGSIQGYDETTLAAVREEKVGTLYKQVLQGIVNSEPRDARAFFMAFKKKIPGTDHAEIEKLIAVGEAKEAAPKLAAQYVSGGITQQTALADVRKKYEGDPNLDLFEREVKAAYAERDAAKRERVGALVDKISVDFGTRYRMADVSAAELNELRTLDGSVWAGMKSHMESKIKSLAGEGSSIRTDYKAYNELYDMAGTDPQKFATTNLWSYRGKLKDGDFEEMKRLQLSVRNSLGKSDAQTEAQAMKDLQTFNGQLKNIFNSMGWTEKEDQERMGIFSSVAADAVRQEESVLGRRLRDEERDILIRKLATKEDAPWYRRSKMYYEKLREGTDAGFKAEISIKDVPLTERKKIEAALTRLKKPVSEAAIIDLYKRRLGVQ